MATARTVLAIVNPKTGRRPIDHFIEPLSQEAARRGILLRVVVTTSPGEATILAQNADEHIDTIIAVGGDGTVSDIVAGVLGRPVSIAILPSGSTNMIARELGIPGTPRAAARIALGGVTRQIDVAVAGERVIVHMAGAGFDAAIMRDTSSRWKRRVRWLAYLPAGARHLNFPQFKYDGWIDGQPVSGTARLLLVAIGSSIIHPRLRLGHGIDRTDRLLYVLAFDPPSTADVTRLLWWVVAGKPERMQWTKHYRGKHIQLSSPDKVPVEFDGDYAGNLPIEVILHPEQVRVCVPAARRYRSPAISMRLPTRISSDSPSRS
ncbi:MAG TPA: diacylglycerol kinase family protein [Thermomicrobiales bacterium]|nr:diacylglycerol kinase family protein [Thermomicrobiales bacterium]